jgi:hypothetical protein
LGFAPGLRISSLLILLLPFLLLLLLSLAIILKVFGS